MHSSFQRHTKSDDEVYRKCTIYYQYYACYLCLRTFLFRNATLFHMPMATIAMIICSIMFFAFAWLLKFGVPLKVCTETATLL